RAPRSRPRPQSGCARPNPLTSPEPCSTSTEETASSASSEPSLGRHQVSAPEILQGHSLWALALGPDGAGDLTGDEGPSAFLAWGRLAADPPVQCLGQ